MDIEKLKLEAQNKALHIADVSGSASANPLDYLGSSKSDAFKNRHYR